MGGEGSARPKRPQEGGDGARRGGVKRRWVAGVFEPGPGDRVYNTAVAFDAHGDLVAAYRKIHLFDALGQRESDKVAPGDEVVIAEMRRVAVPDTDLIEQGPGPVVPHLPEPVEAEAGLGSKARAPELRRVGSDKTIANSLARISSARRGA